MLLKTYNIGLMSLEELLERGCIVFGAWRLSCKGGLAGVVYALNSLAESCDVPTEKKHFVGRGGAGKCLHHAIVISRASAVVPNDCRPKESQRLLVSDRFHLIVKTSRYFVGLITGHWLYLLP